jgi:protein-disulfide isomerase
MNRNVFVAVAAAVLIAAGIGYYAWGNFGASSGDVASDVTQGLLEPGPLPDQSLGKADAPITIIEYGSMTCPHCADFHTKTFPTLKEKYIDTGKVHFIFREYPLDELALSASMLARCAGSPRYFPMVDVLFQQQRRWATQNPLPELLIIARQAGFTQKTFEDCLQDKKLYADVAAMRDRASSKFKVESTPTFFINGRMLRGEFAARDIDKLLQPYLASAK